LSVVIFSFQPLTIKAFLLLRGLILNHTLLIPSLIPPFFLSISQKKGY
jgi:hypothetical protein